MLTFSLSEGQLFFRSPVKENGAGGGNLVVSPLVGGNPLQPLRVGANEFFFSPFHLIFLQDAPWEKDCPFNLQASLPP